MTFVSISSGRFTSGVADAFIGTRAPAYLPPILYGHGAGNSSLELVGGSGLAAVPPIVQALSRLGYVVVCPTETQTWGNATSISRLDDALSYARTNLGAHPTADPFIIGASHGASCVLRWHQDNQARAAVLYVPSVDLEDIRTNNTLGQRATIDAAHGVTWISDRNPPLPVGVNPYDNTADYVDLPQLIWYSTDDAISNGVTTYATAVGADLRSVGALGHTNAAMAAASIPDTLAFIQAHT